MYQHSFLTRCLDIPKAIFLATVMTLAQPGLSQESSVTLSTENWRDNGAWMNSVSKMDQALEGREKVIAINVQSQSLVYRPLPAMTKGKVYQIKFKHKEEGQIERLEFQVRKIPHPWTDFGKQKPAITQDWQEEEIQVRVPEDTQKNDFGFYVLGSGVGKILVSEMHISEMDDFLVSSRNNTVPRGEILFNSRFQLGDVGWSLRSCKIEQGRLAMSCGAALTENPFELRLGKKYTIRVEAADSDAKLKVECYDESRKAFQQWTPAFNEEGVWENSFEIRVPERGVLQTRKQAYLCVHSSGTVRLKAVSLVESAPDTPWENASIKMEAGVRFEKDGNLVRRVKNRIPIDVAVRVTGAEEGCKAVVKIKDLYGSVAKLSGVITKLPDASLGFVARNVILPPGWFDARVEINQKKIVSAPSEVAILLPVQNDPAASGFVLGSHLEFWKQTSDKGLEASTAGIRRLNDAKMLGIDSVRLHPPWTTQWWYVEPQENMWRFSDSIVDEPITAGLSVLGLLHTTAKYATSAPEQIMQKNKTGSGGNPTPDNWGVYPPANDADWRKYVHTIVSHYKGRINAWEIWNEPDHSFLQLPPNWPETKEQVYARLVKSAAEEIRNIDPKIKIVIGAVTAGGKPFLLNAISLGVLDSCDAISFHGYGRVGAADKGALAFADMCDPLRRAMREAGKNLEIWDSEAAVGPVADGRKDIKTAQLELKGVLARRAAGMQRLYLYNGFEKSNPLHGDWRMTWGFNDRPLPIQAMLTTCQHFLGAAKFVKNIGDDAAGTHVYLFEKGGQKIIAAWAVHPQTFTYQAKITGKSYSEVGASLGDFGDGILALTRNVRYFCIKDPKE